MDSLGGIPLDEIGATGYGLAQCAEVAARFCDLSLKGATVAIEGFGNVGKHAAHFLGELGVSLIAASAVYPGRTDPEFTAGLKLAPNYLQRTGNRLPTEAEMEYVIRANATTARHYGETDDLLPKYGWYLKNSRERSWPVGALKPNDLGLFDSHGNVHTWCQAKYGGYPRPQDAEPHDD